MRDEPDMPSKASSLDNTRADCGRKFRAFLGAGIGLAAMGLWMGTAHAGGIALPLQDTDTIGTAFGSAATDDSPAIAYNNPAGMVLIQGNAFEGDLQYYDINSSFTGKDTLADGTSPSGSGNAKGFLESTLVPGTFGVISLPFMGAKLGLTVTTPDGGRIKYQDSFQGRYQGLEALLTEVQVGIPIAIPITDQFSVAAGPEIDWFQNYENLNNNEGTLNAQTPDGDGAAGRFRGSNYAVGFEAGAMYQLSPDTRFGVSYHSKITHDIKGTETVGINPSLRNELTALSAIIPGLAPPPYGSPAADNFTLPQFVTFGVYQKLSRQMAFMASAEWQNWSSVAPLIISDAAVAPLAGGSIYTPFHYRDTWTIGAGLNYFPDQIPGLKLMSGVGYDETPIPDEAAREDAVPDNNRIMLSVGGAYQLRKNLKLQAAYSHFFLENSAISQSRQSLGTAGPQATAAGTLNGNYGIDVNVFSTGLVLSF
jgi:long-chain fatty acid transport protein